MTRLRKLTDVDVDFIRFLRIKRGLALKVLAVQFGVTTTCISLICRGRRRATP